MAIAIGDKVTIKSNVRVRSVATGKLYMFAHDINGEVIGQDIRQSQGKARFVVYLVRNDDGGAIFESMEAWLSKRDDV